MDGRMDGNSEDGTMKSDDEDSDEAACLSGVQSRYSSLLDRGFRGIIIANRVCVASFGVGSITQLYADSLALTLHPLVFTWSEALSGL